MAFGSLTPRNPLLMLVSTVLKSLCMFDEKSKQTSFRAAKNDPLNPTRELTCVSSLRSHISYLT